MTRLPLALSMGDPAGCGPSITAQAWSASRRSDARPFYVCGDPAAYRAFCPVTEITAPEQAADAFANALPVLPLSAPLPAFVPGEPDSALAPAIIESIKTATAHCLSGQAGAIVTNPISKAVLYRAGFKHPGHTEFIAQLCSDATGTPFKPVMMLVGGGLRVALATIHVPLMQVSGRLSIDGLVTLGVQVHTALQRDFGFASPRLAFTGLNPHAGEDATIGTEERDIINPAAAELRAQGISIGPARPADTVFHEALSGQFDAVIAMTHDQGLIPVKTLDLWGGVNTTLGLPIIRTSPDHGTAYDAAAKSIARPDSLIAALKQADAMAQNRARTHA